MTSLDELREIVGGWLRWYRIRRSLDWGFRGLAAGLAAGLPLAAYAYLSLQFLADEFLAIAGALGLGGLALGILLGVFWPADLLRTARFFDLRFDLKERVSTAFELAQRDPGPTSELAAAQAADAVAAARTVQPARQLPLRLPRRELLLAVFFAGASLLFWYSAGDLFERAAQQRRVDEAIAGEVENIEELLEAIETSPELTDEQKAALAEPLNQALEDLAAAETLEDAVSALNEAEQALQELGDPAAELAASQLQNSGSELAQEGGALEEFNQSLADGDLEQAAQDLRDVDAAALEQEQLDQLADQLEALANSVQNSDPALADQLRAGAQAARAGDAQAAQEALDQAAEAIQELGEQAALTDAADAAAQGLQSGQQGLAQAGQPGESGQEGPSTLPGSGEGGQQGQSGSSSETGGSSSEAGSGESSGGQPGGSSSGDPIGQNNNPDGLGESGFEPITPSTIGGESSNWVTIPPSGLEGENIVGTGQTGEGTPSSSTVPYTQVLPIYQQAANQAIENGLIPLEYRDLIRQYFSSLEPN